MSWDRDRSKLGSCQDKRDRTEVRIYAATSVVRFLEMTTASVNRMARMEEIPELDVWDK